MRWLVLLALAGCGTISGGGGDDTMSPDAGWGVRQTMMPGGDGSPPPTAADLLAKLSTCNKVGGDYATDSGGAQTIPICGLSNAVFWKADMDIDCDGKQSPQCNSSTDPSWQNQTSATDSHGNPLDAANLPYVVVPLPSTRFDYATAGLDFGSVIAVIYNNKLEYAVFGDEGPSSIIGEASYATAAALGIDPNPATGGVDSGVAYIAFTGAAAVVPVIEDHAMAVQLGIARARALLAGP
jgi:hypothetical protein